VSKHENAFVCDLLFDVSLGLISEKEFKARLTAAGITDFKAELKKSLKELTEDRVGFREVNTDQFSKLVRSMEIVSSAQQVEVIGVTKDRAYLEVSLFLTGNSRYVAVVAAKLVDLPEAIVKKLK
jgi:Ca2+-binding EF-hand superfamily protein